MKTREQIRDEMIARYEAKQRVSIKEDGNFWALFDTVARSISDEIEELEEYIRNIGGIND